MFGVGTSIYSVLFVGAFLIIGVVGILFLVRVWSAFFKNLRKAVADEKPLPSFGTPIVKTIVVVTIFIVVLTLVWNAKQKITTSTSNYKRPAEISEQKEVRESQLPKSEEFDKALVEQKNRAETKPHQDALKSFDEKMKSEANKIKERSLGDATEKK